MQAEKRVLDQLVVRTTKGIIGNTIEARVRELSTLQKVTGMKHNSPVELY